MNKVTIHTLKKQKLAGQKICMVTAYDATSETMNKVGHDVTEFVKKHPIPSLVAGFAAGLLIGRLARII